MLCNPRSCSDAVNAAILLIMWSLQSRFLNEKQCFGDAEVSCYELSSHISAVRAFAKSDSRGEPMGSLERTRRPMGTQGGRLLSSRERLVTGQAGK